MIRLVAVVVAPLLVVIGWVALTPYDDPGSGLLTVTGPDADRTPTQDVVEAIEDLPGRYLQDRGDTQRQDADRSSTRVRTPPRAVTDDPLAVTIDTMSPGVIPTRGPILLSGTVTNTTDDTWTDLNIYPFVSYLAMQTSRQVELATQTDPELFIGRRILTVTQKVTELLPGRTVRWSLRIPRTALAGRIQGAEGVYWIGAHVLGTDSTGRDEPADGRARTFIPLLEPGHSAVPVTLVLPVRHQVQHTRSGKLAEEAAWTADLQPGGRLANLLAFARGAGDRRLTWAIDPAVIDAVRKLAAGNPGRDLAPTDGQPGDPPPVEDPGTAAAWVAELVRLAQANGVLGLPYGDLDVVAASEFEPDLVTLAEQLSAATLAASGISAAPAVVPPSGFIDEDTLDVLPARTLVLLSDEAAPSREDTPPAAVRYEDRTIDLFDAAASSGGPGPDPRLSPLALRQRILAESAVRAVGGVIDPLVVSLPADFDPGAPGYDFFETLDQPFVNLVPLGQPATAEPAVESLVYPERQEERELNAGSFRTATDLMAAGESLDRLLTRNDSLARSVLGEALSSASYQARNDPFAATSAARNAVGWLDEQKAKVRIDAPPFVILSAESGRFAVTVTNDLEQPVAIKIQAHRQGDLVIKAPKLVELEAGQVQTISLVAQATSIGVHQVSLVATDESGAQLGLAEEVSIRSNEVGQIIWVVLGSGVAILFLAILVRLVRRVRRARAA